MSSSDFAAFFSWYSFYDTIENGFKAITIPHSNDSSYLQDLVAFHEHTDTLTFALVCALFLALITWILSLITGLHTWVDKWWSIVPVIYAIHYTIHDCLYGSTDTPNIRLWIPTVLICIWGARLTYNFHRKGGYTLRFVDYRWTYVQARVHPALFFIFNIIFICFYQNIILVLLPVPLYAIQQAAYIEKTPLNWIDALATIGLIGFITLEHVADNQQWAFYEKRRFANENKKFISGDVKRGFLSHGLFRYSRHPNFFAEIMIWWCVYLYSVAASYPIHFW